jgi:EAL domain-containing protein (putative c-di-GMP-specific phosphodiesterase class I)
LPNPNGGPKPQPSPDSGRGHRRHAARPDDLALTSAIIAMAHSLGITVTGEGVESEGQLAMLRDPAA